MSPYNIHQTENETRIEIDQNLMAAGWQLQDKNAVDLCAGENGLYEPADHYCALWIRKNDVTGERLNDWDSSNGLLREI